VLGEALNTIRRGDADIMLAGGFFILSIYCIYFGIYAPLVRGHLVHDVMKVLCRL
jgi:hypothetical protein